MELGMSGNCISSRKEDLGVAVVGDPNSREDIYRMPTPFLGQILGKEQDVG